jgi:hypothetical protein
VGIEARSAHEVTRWGLSLEFGLLGMGEAGGELVGWLQVCDVEVS